MRDPLDTMGYTRRPMRAPSSPALATSPLAAPGRAPHPTEAGTLGSKGYRGDAADGNGLEPISKNLLTAVIIAKNEAVHILDAVQALRWADEVLVVVDPSSTDRTLEIAGNIGGNVRVLTHEFEGFAAQRNWSIEAASHPWILMIDADERPSEALVASIRNALRAVPERDAYQIYRRNFMFGRELKHGGMANDRVTRFFRQNLRYGAQQVHEDLCGAGPLGTLEGHLVHMTYRDLGHYLGKMHQYAVLGAQQTVLDGSRPGVAKIFLRPAARFLKQFIIRGGFLDGMPGALYASMASYSVFLKYAVAWELQHSPPPPPDGFSRPNTP